MDPLYPETPLEDPLLTDHSGPHSKVPPETEPEYPETPLEDPLLSVSFWAPLSFLHHFFDSKNS